MPRPVSYLPDRITDSDWVVAATLVMAAVGVVLSAVELVRFVLWVFRQL